MTVPKLVQIERLDALKSHFQGSEKCQGCMACNSKTKVSRLFIDLDHAGDLNRFCFNCACNGRIWVFGNAVLLITFEV